jgi:hypothetical protein
MKKLLLFVALALTLNTMMAQGDNRTEYFISEIKDAQEALEKHNPPGIYLVRPESEKWLANAVSMKAREEWEKTTIMTPEQKKQVDAAYSALAAVAAKKIPLHIPEAKHFAAGTDAEKNMLKSFFFTKASPDQFTVYQYGLEDQNWRIDKDEYNMPTGRRKWGYVYYKGKPGIHDHPYCRLMEAYIYQPYAGGGTYGESEVYFEAYYYSGCPK